jgi:hypothetical protein
MLSRIYFCINVRSYSLLGYGGSLGHEAAKDNSILSVGCGSSLAADSSILSGSFLVNGHWSDGARRQSPGQERPLM